ncbi:MAG: dihydrodipicolinate synthase family protein [Lautropia sp.]
MPSGGAMAGSPRLAKPLVLNGLYPATITPFADDLSVDFGELERHLRDTCAASGVAGIAVNGGLGELLQLTPDEQIAIVRLAARVRRPGQLVIAGVEGRSARTVCETSLALKAAGAEALLVFPPFDVRAYRRLAGHVPSVHAFFAELDRHVDLPMIVFQYPPQSGLPYPIDALRSIAAIRNVVAIKAASAILPAYAEVWDALHDQVSIMAAVDSPPLLEMLRHGAHGALIGISAIVPQTWADLLSATARGDGAAAEAIFDKVCRPLMASVFENQQPRRMTHEAAAVKEALVQLGQLGSSRVRPPAVDVDDDVRQHIRESLQAAELLRR